MKRELVSEVFRQTKKKKTTSYPSLYCRSNTTKVFCKKVALKNFAKFTAKHLCQSPFFNKVAGLRSESLLKWRLCHKRFLVNFVKLLRTFFFFRTPQVAASYSVTMCLITKLRRMRGSPVRLLSIFRIVVKARSLNIPYIAKDITCCLLFWNNRPFDFPEEIRTLIFNWKSISDTGWSIVMSIDNHIETIDIISLITNLLGLDIPNECFRDT